MYWDWDKIATISSVIGVIGGIVSVIFLVYEVRHNAKAIEGATVQSLMGLEREVFTLLVQNVDLFARGGKNISRLSATDKFKFERIVSAEISLFYSAFVQFNRELISAEVWEAYLNAVKRNMGRPGFAQSWNAIKDSYPESFRSAIESAQSAWRRDEKTTLKS